MNKSEEGSLKTRKSTIDEIENATILFAEYKLKDNNNSLQIGEISHHLIAKDSIYQVPQDAASETCTIFVMAHIKTSNL